MESSLFIIILCTLIASAFFSGMEIAFVSANRLKIELDKKKGNVSGKILGRFVKYDANFIATMLLGNNIALVIYGIQMAKLLEPLIKDYIPDGTVLLVQTVVSTLLILVTAEFLPKAIFQINPNRILLTKSAKLYTQFNVLASTEPVIRPKTYPKGYIAHPTSTINLIALKADATDSFEAAA